MYLHFLSFLNSEIFRLLIPLNMVIYLPSWIFKPFCNILKFVQYIFILPASVKLKGGVLVLCQFVRPSVHLSIRTQGIWNQYDKWLFSPLNPAAGWLSHLALVKTVPVNARAPDGIRPSANTVLTRKLDMIFPKNCSLAVNKFQHVWTEWHVILWNDKRFCCTVLVTSCHLVSDADLEWVGHVYWVPSWIWHTQVT